MAVIVLWLVTQYCRIPREEVGLAGRRSSPLPTVYTVAGAVGVVFGAGVVKTAFAAVSTPDLVGGVVDNGWAVPGIISRSVNAGVTEEITLTALPVLLLTRLGWRMPYIVAVSAVLRWPYHLWHGWPSSLPWALIWGAGFVVIYLIWRRLTALIMTHAVVDIVLNLDRLYHLDAVLLVVVPVLVTLVMLWRCLSWRRQQRPAGSGFESLPKQAQRFIPRPASRRVHRGPGSNGDPRTVWSVRHLPLAGQAHRTGARCRHQCDCRCAVPRGRGELPRWTAHRQLRNHQQWPRTGQSAAVATH